MKNKDMQERILLFKGPDRPGLIADLALIISASGGNIITSEQHTTDEGLFFLRFLYKGEDLTATLLEKFPQASFSCRKKRKKRIHVFVSKTSHCLADLLWRADSGAPFEILSVISNREDTEELTKRYGIPFHFVPQGADRKAGERDLLRHLDPDADFSVLARYMRILSGDFLSAAAMPFINVHHSFLPAFPGAEPYEKAYERGVKIIGATAHYVIEELDAGAIIAQRTMDVSHSDSIADLKAKGREEERLVLADAVTAHAEDRIIVYDNKTVVFR
jgi:formyltetrahydrofolate deformylase